ncbi:MAG: hypothetical protein AAF206_30485 [Bacteroidota bacterium]
MKASIIPFFFVLAVIAACTPGTPADKSTAELPSSTFQNKGHELIDQLVQKVGRYQQLLDKKDVVYTYTYQTPDGETDISTEKYRFDGELSYGAYQQHERTLSALAGLIEQGYDGETYWLKNNGTLVEDSASLKRVAFNRPTNFYWFAMFQKLLDPGLQYEYLGEKQLDSATYDIVKVSFPAQTERPTDIYQLYLNQETALVDQFLFTVADFGVMEKPFLMQVKYEEVDGILIPTQRQYKASDWEGSLSDAPWVKVNWSNIQFDNGLTQADFQP